MLPVRRDVLLPEDGAKRLSDQFGTFSGGIGHWALYLCVRAMIWGSLNSSNHFENPSFNLCGLVVTLALEHKDV